MEKICETCKNKFDAAAGWQKVCKSCYKELKEKEETNKPQEKNGQAERIARSVGLNAAVAISDKIGTEIPMSDKVILERAETYTKFILTGARP